MTGDLDTVTYGSLKERLSAYFSLGLYRLLAHAPIDAASDLGSLIVRRNVARNLPHIIAGARHNLARLHPEWTGQEVEAGVRRFLDNVGRLYTEFPVLHRLVAEGRLTFDADHILMLRDIGRPLVVAMLHTGNWEVFGAALSVLGIPVSTFFLPPEPAIHDALVRATRARLGFSLLQPDARGVRQALRLLSNGGRFAIFADDARGGETMAPLFGRPPHARGNLALISRFARGANALVVTGHCVRHTKSRFTLHVSAPMDLEREVGAKASVLDDVAFLNQHIEPIIRAHADQWYFLDDRF